MKNTTFLIILFLSLGMSILGVVKKKDKVKEMGYAGCIFLLIAKVSDFICGLDF